MGDLVVTMRQTKGETRVRYHSMIEEPNPAEPGFSVSNWRNQYTGKWAASKSNKTRKRPKGQCCTLRWGPLSRWKSGTAP